MMIVVGSAERDLRQEDPRQRVHEPEVAHHEVQRRDRHRDREHQACGEQRVQRPPPGGSLYLAIT